MKRLWLPVLFLALVLFALTAVAVAAPMRRPMRRPPPKAPEPWAVPADPIPVVTPSFQKLEVNGLPVRVRTESRIPGAEATLAVRTLSGVASPTALSLLTGALLRVGGTTEHAGPAFPAFLARNGLTLEVTTDPDFLALTVRTAADQLPAALNLLSGLATTPAYPKAEIERSVQVLGGLAGLRARQPLTAATDQLNAKLFGTHPYAARIDARELTGLTREVLLQAHARAFAPNRAMLAVTSQLEPAALQSLVAEAFKGWKAGTPDAKDVRVAPPKPAGSPEPVKLPVAGASTALVAGRVVIAANDLDHVATRVLARTLDEAVRAKLAGAATGRSGAALTRYADASLLRIWAEGPQLAPLRTTLRSELARAGRGELTDFEINRARVAVQREVLENLGNVSALVEASMLEELEGHDAAWPSRQIELLRTLAPEEVRRVARTLVSSDALTFVVSGSEAALAEAATGSQPESLPSAASPVGPELTGTGKAVGTTGAGQTGTGQGDTGQPGLVPAVKGAGATAGKGLETTGPAAKGTGANGPAGKVPTGAAPAATTAAGSTPTGKGTTAAAPGSVPAGKASTAASGATGGPAASTARAGQAAPGAARGYPGAHSLKGGKGMNHGARGAVYRRGQRGQGWKGAGQGARRRGYQRLPRKQPVHPQTQPSLAPPKKDPPAEAKP